jgi:hypothetical protein
MSAAPSWPLVIVAFWGEPSEARLRPLPGFEFFFGFGARSAISGNSSPEFVLQTFRTQNDARGARPHPPVRSISLRTAKARNSLFSQRLKEVTPPCPAKPCFRAATPIWGSNRGDSRVKLSNPHKFPCSTCARASLLQAGVAGRPEGRPAACLVRGSPPDSGLSSRSPGISLQ